MLAKEIAAQLEGQWDIKEEDTLYPDSRTKIHIKVQSNNSLSALNFINDENVKASDEVFVQDLMSIVGNRLTTTHEMLIMEILAKRLSQWSVQGKSNDALVLHFFEKLIKQHKSYCANNSKQ